MTKPENQTIHVGDADFAVTVNIHEYSGYSSGEVSTNWNFHYNADKYGSKVHDTAAYMESCPYLQGNPCYCEGSSFGPAPEEAYKWAREAFEDSHPGK